MVQLGPGMYSQSTSHCAECKGQGTFIKQKNRCQQCSGDGTIKEKKVISCDVAPGVPDGYKYTFYGEADEAYDCQPGDIIVEVHVTEHSTFKRKGFDLITKQKVPLVEALTGFKVEIIHLDEKKRFITSAPGEIITPGDIKTVKELGLPKFSSPWEFGNLFIQFDVEFPSSGSLSSKAMAALQKALPPSPNMDLEPP